MNELESYQSQLPDAIEDLTKFVLVGKAQLSAYMSRLRTVNKLSVAQEIRNQTLQETQELANALIAAEQRIGEILLAIPKASGRYAESENRPVSKNTVIKDMGYSKDEAFQYQQMAQNPEAVKVAVQKAIDNGDVVSRNQVMKEIRSAKAELERQLAEKDKRISELESRKPEVREVVKEVTVVPEDYESLKADNKLAWDEQRRVAKELQDAKKRLRDYEGKEGENEIQTRLENDADYFNVLVTDFIRKVGSYVWVADRVELLPDVKRKNLIKSMINLDGWCQAMIRNIGGDLIE